MGFGLLFLGYVTLLFFKIVPVGVLGAYLMHRALSKLSPYGENFVKAKNISRVMFVYFALYTVLWVLNTFGFSGIFSSYVFVICDMLLYYGIFCTFNICLCKALSDISRQTGYEKGERKAKVCITASYVFAVGVIIRGFLYFFSASGYVAFTLAVYEFVLLVMTTAFIYCCYMMIATDEIIDEENKKIREYDEKYSMLKRKKGK